MMYMLLAVVLMSMDQRGQYVPKVRSTMELAFEPIYALVGWPSQAWQSLAEQFAARNELIEDNQQLNQALLKNAGAIQRLAALEQENRRLRKLLSARQGRAYNFTFAEMIRVDLDPFSHKVWIDHGQEQGIVSGQVVIDGLGVVGQVERAFGGSSTVRLISDPDHALPVQINRTGLRSVAFGTGKTGQLIMPNVPQQADVSVGDVIVTSGLGDRFPPGFPVGEVEKIERDTGESFARAYVRPYAALDRGREVLVVEPYVPVHQAEPGTDPEPGDIPGPDSETQPDTDPEPGGEEGPDDSPESGSGAGSDDNPEPGGGAGTGNSPEPGSEAQPDNIPEPTNAAGLELP